MGKWLQNVVWFFVGSISMTLSLSLHAQDDDNLTEVLAASESVVSDAQLPETKGVAVEGLDAERAPSDLAAEDFTWINDLNNYSTNQYTIVIPLTPENLKQLTNRFSLYRFSLIYIPIKELQSGKQAYIHIGFYSNEQDLIDFTEDSKFLYSDQRVERVSVQEHTAVMAAAQAKEANKQGDYYVFAIGANTVEVFKRVSKDILAAGKELYVAKKYQEASVQYQLLSIIAGDDETAAWATELYGLCFEKQKEFSDAIDVYEQLLTDFPETSGVPRVEQRLRGLTTAASDEQNRVGGKDIETKEIRVFTRGVFGQHYRTLTRTVNNQESEEVSSYLTSNFDVRSTATWKDHTIKARFNGFHVSDQFDPDNSDLRLKRVFIDYKHRETGTSVALGRIKQYDSGQFTQFDGLTVSYPVRENIRVGASVGTPVYYSGVYENLNYFFYSGHGSWAINDEWRVNGYVLSQTLNDVTDRQAVGFRTQYYTDKMTSSLNVDFDVAFGELNNLVWRGSYTLTDKTSFGASLGSQRSPFLTATNIFIGQPDLDLDLYLQSQANQDSLLDDALARTSINQYFTLTYNQELFEDILFGLDFTQSNLTDIPSLETLLGLVPVDDVLEGEDTSSFSQSSFGGQFVVQKLFSQSDAVTLGLRASSSENSEVLLFYLNERIRIGKKWTIQPKFSYAQSKILRNNTDQQTWRYSLSVLFRPWKTSEISIEAGGDNLTTGLDDSKFDSIFIFAGYRLYF